MKCRPEFDNLEPGAVIQYKDTLLMAVPGNGCTGCFLRLAYDCAKWRNTYSRYEDKDVILVPVESIME